MTDKQTVIDGIDISGCEHVFIHTSLFNENTLVQCSAFFLENGDSCCDCSDNPNCYYKQLKRKEQECKKLKQTLTEIKDYCNKYPQNSIGFKQQILQICDEVISE